MLMSNNVTLKKGYRIVKRGDSNRESAPIDCPLCLCVNIDELDSISISRSGCCYDCELEISDRNREKWIAGWRPGPDELAEIRAKRLSSPHSRLHT